MKNPYLYLFKTTWTYAEGRRGIFLFTCFLFAIANGITMLEPLVLAKTLNTIQAGGPNVLSSTMWLLLLYASLTFFFWCFHGPARILERTTAFHIRKNFTLALFQTVMKLPVPWHKDHHSGETYDKIYKAQSALENFADDTFMYLETSIRLLLSIIAILWFLPKYGFLAVLMGTIMMVISLRFDRFLIHYRVQLNKSGHGIAAALFDYISNVRTIITLRLQRLVNQELKSRIQQLFPIFSKNIRVNEWKWFTHGMFMAVIIFFTLLLYVSEQLNTGEVIAIGSIMALFQYVDRFSNAFFGLGWQWESLTLSATDIRSAETILKAYESMKKKPIKKPLPKSWKIIDIKKLIFRYEDEKHHMAHLTDISLHLERGKRIALVGESGSGKSTLMSLLRGLDIPGSCKIMVDEKSYPFLSILSDTTTLFPQEPEIFENTIEYNISLGLSHGKSEVMKAVRLAEFEKVLKRLPKGLESSIKEKGVNLSGGEKQRLALARGIFAAQDSSIILLDEPTSSVDSMNEMKIYRNLFERFKKQCIVSTIHRLHLLPLFDYLYIFDKGSIIEHGTFQELKNKEGSFLKKLWQQYH